MSYHLASWNIKDADIIVDPKLGIKLGIVHWNKFLEDKNIILAGESAMKKKLPQLQKLIYQKSKGGLKKYLEFFKE